MKLPRLLTAVSALALATVAGYSAASLRQGPAAPTEAHEWLTGLAGTWDGKVTGMMGEMDATNVVKPGPGGRWIVGNFEMDMGGMPFQGLELMGYDPDSKQFQQVWIDSMSNRPMTMTGTFDKATKTLTMRGISTTAAPDGSEVEMTHILTYPDADHSTFTMTSPGEDGNPVTAMEISYTRRK